jgi:glycosyltransferase involved in cell wall biosynthesis
MNLSLFERLFERWPDMDARRNHRMGPQSNDKLPAAHWRARADRGERESLRQKLDDGNPRRPGADEIVILIPVWNDWASLEELLPRLDQELSLSGVGADILVVDDGSLLDADGRFDGSSFDSIGRIDVLRLRRNLGHQRAIAIGLAYVEDCLSASVVVVMDADGEDDPADVPRLLARLREEGHQKVVFAERSRRSESFTFRIFYVFYKVLHYLLTGKGVRVGNFSAIPRRRLSSLVVVAEMWNHYAAAVLRSRQPHCMIPTRRRRRLCGRSSMNFVSLVAHGLSAISVYSDVVGVRLLVMSILMAVFTMGGIVAAVIVRLATYWAVPGWASYTVGILLILLVQAVMAAFVFSFVILGSRHGSTFLPRRDYSFFIGGLWALHGEEQSLAPLPVPDLQSDFIVSGA